MKTRIATAALIAALSQSAFAGDHYWSNIDNGFDNMVYAQKDNAAYWDGVQSSFANMLNHQPYAGPTAVTVALGEPDAAAAIIHASLRGEGRMAFARKGAFDADAVAASFDRMLNHEPYAGPTGTTLARGQDHRVDRLVHTLRQELIMRVKLAAAQNNNTIK